MNEGVACHGGDVAELFASRPGSKGCLGLGAKRKWLLNGEARKRDMLCHFGGPSAAALG